jgi:hypothetical protein
MSILGAVARLEIGRPFSVLRPWALGEHAHACRERGRHIEDVLVVGYESLSQVTGGSLWRGGWFGVRDSEGGIELCQFKETGDSIRRVPENWSPPASRAARRSRISVPSPVECRNVTPSISRQSSWQPAEFSAVLSATNKLASACEIEIAAHPQLDGLAVSNAR